MSLMAVLELGPTIPPFGVCMGLQCIGEVFGGKINIHALLWKPFGVARTSVWLRDVRPAAAHSLGTQGNQEDLIVQSFGASWEQALPSTQKQTRSISLSSSIKARRICFSDHLSPPTENEPITCSLM